MLSGLIALFVSNFIGGALSPLFVKLGTAEIPIALFTSFRFLIAIIVLLPIILVTKNKFDKKHVKELVLYSLFFSANVILYAIGLKFTTALVSQILYTTVPIFTGILSYLIIHERFGFNKIAGAIIAMTGVGLIIYESLQKTGGLTFGTPLGNSILMVAILSWSMYLVMSKRLTSIYSPLVTSFSSFVITFIIALLFVPFELLTSHFLFSSVTTSGTISVLGVGIFSSAFSFFLIQYGVKKTTPFIASLFFYLAPLFSSLTALPILHEKVSIQLVLGGLLIITGVFFATTYEFIKKMRFK